MKFVKNGQKIPLGKLGWVTAHPVSYFLMSYKTFSVNLMFQKTAESLNMSEKKTGNVTKSLYQR